MSNAVRARSHTPYQMLKNSPVGRFVGDNKLITAGGLIGGSLVVAGGAAKSPAFAKVAEKAIVPGAGAAMSVVGGTMVHDAIVNDFGKGRNGTAVGKTFAGTVMALGGAEIVGRVYDIKGLDQALTRPVKVAWNAIDGVFGKHWKAIGGGALVAGGAGVLGTAVADASRNGIKERNVLGGAVGATMIPGGAAVLASVAGKEALATSAGKAAGAIGGAGLAALGLTRGMAAVESFRKGSLWGTAANATLATTAGAGGLWLFGESTGIKALSKAGEKIFEPLAEHVLQPAGKFFLEHPVVGGAVVLGGVGTAAYMYFNKNGKK